MIVKFKKLSPDAVVPSKKSDDDAGYDLRSSIDYDLYPNEIKIIPTDIAIELPKGTFGMVVSRSGLASRGIVVNNAPGIVDCNYRAGIGIILRNQTNDVFKICKGDRLAQMLIMDYNNVGWLVETNLSETDRGEGGFGSTGMK